MTAKFFAAVQRMVKRENPFRVQTQGLTPPPPETTEAPPRVGPHLVRVDPGTEANTWIVSWDAIPAEGGYEYQTNQDPRRFDLWSGRTRTDLPRAIFTLSSRSSPLWVRVRAFTLNGPGPWSDPIQVGQADSSLPQAA